MAHRAHIKIELVTVWRAVVEGAEGLKTSARRIFVLLAKVREEPKGMWEPQSSILAYQTDSSVRIQVLE